MPTAELMSVTGAVLTDLVMVHRKGVRTLVRGNACWGSSTALQLVHEVKTRSGMS